MLLNKNGRKTNCGHFYLECSIAQQESNLDLQFSPANAKWSHQESNLDLEFRKLLFYPLNYETTLPAGYSIH